MELFGDFNAEECQRFFPWVIAGVERIQLPWDSREVLQQHNTTAAHVPTMMFVPPELLTAGADTQHPGIVQYGYIPISALSGGALGDPKQALSPHAMPYIIGGGQVYIQDTQHDDGKQNVENVASEGSDPIKQNPAMVPLQMLVPYPRQFPMSQVINVPNPGILTSYSNTAQPTVTHVYSMIPTMYSPFAVAPSQPNEEIAKVPRPPVEGAADNEINVCSIPPSGLIVENVALPELKTRLEMDSSDVGLKQYPPPKIAKDVTTLANPKSFSPIQKVDSNCLEQRPIGNTTQVYTSSNCTPNTRPGPVEVPSTCPVETKTSYHQPADNKDIDYDALEDVDYDDTNVCTTKIYTSSAFEQETYQQLNDNPDQQQEEEDEEEEEEEEEDGENYADEELEHSGEEPLEPIVEDAAPEVSEERAKEVPEKPTPPPPTNKPSSWAALFKPNNNNASSNSTAAPVQQAPAAGQNRPPPVVAVQQPDVQRSAPPVYNGQQNGSGKGSPRVNYEMPVKPEEDNYSMFLGKFFSNLRVKNNQVALQPRGLVNRGNWCYINSILQALLACPPFFQLIRNIPNKVYKERGPSCTPTVDCFHRLAMEFNMMPLANRRDRPKDSALFRGSEYEPVDVYKMLQKIRSHLSAEGRQEDAEEFLNCVLDGMHEEMASVIRYHSSQSEADETADDDAAGTAGLVPVEPNPAAGGEGEWEQVGPKNKISVTRSTEIKKTPISDIFSGELRSVVSTSGNRDSATLQPFFTLPLDIQSEKIQYIDEALENLFMKEAIHGFTNTNTKTEVEASRRYSIEKLPQVLILHLKRFIYDKTGCQKNTKEVKFNIELEMNPSALSNGLKKLNKKQRSYKLFAIVYHVGNNAVGGHYVTDFFHPILSAWVKADDNKIDMPISIPRLMKFNQTQVPYILFYRRADLV